MSIATPTPKITKSRLFATSFTVTAPHSSEHGSLAVTYEERHIGAEGAVLSARPVDGGIIIHSGEIGPEWGPLVGRLIALWEAHGASAIAKENDRRAKEAAASEERARASKEMASTRDEAIARRRTAP
jgi:hypothetical protein